MRGANLYIFSFVSIFFGNCAGAQSLEISLGDDSLTAVTLQLLAVITVISVAPGLVIMVTCFPFLVTVLSILRQAIGLQQAPPNMLIVSLALFLTFFVMEPVFLRSWEDGFGPLSRQELSIDEALNPALLPFKEFMVGRIDSEIFYSMLSLRNESQESLNSDSPLAVLISSFLLSEISRAFQIGFLIFLPFLIIDLVVAAILMSMGMMMVPPAIVSLPFKLAFFVLADGWALISSSLVRSYF